MESFVPPVKIFLKFNILQKKKLYLFILIIIDDNRKEIFSDDPSIDKFIVL